MMPFIVAELSANHNGSIDTAMRLIAQCAAAGVNAVKLQTWTPGTMVVDKTLVIDSGPWAGRNMSELYEQAHTPWEWHQPLFDHAKSLGLIAFSSVFDLQALEFLERIKCPMYKISSFDMTDLQLIDAVAHTGKPMVISTGMASYIDIRNAAWKARASGCDDLTLLKCTSAYPAPPEAINLNSMNDLMAFSDKVGLSDHTLGIGVAVAATALGADMIEKHVTLDRNDGGLDAAFSLEPNELAMLVKECRDAHLALGKAGSFGDSIYESSQTSLRKSLYVIKDLKKGDVLTKDNIGAARPASGLPLSDFDKLLYKRAAMRIPAGTPMSWDWVSK